MKKVILLFCLFFSMVSYGQEKLIKDLDGDTLPDTVFLSTENSKIICVLSTRGSKHIMSGQLELSGDQNGVRSTKSGFELYSSFMRAGHGCQFRFDKVTGKIQLIGMSEYEFGNAANDGSGKGSINLLTNTYIGEWNAYDNLKEKLITLPVIKEKMTFGKIYLEKFDDKKFDDFAAKSAALYYKQKSIYIKEQ